LFNSVENEERKYEDKPRRVIYHKRRGKKQTEKEARLELNLGKFWYYKYKEI